MRYAPLTLTTLASLVPEDIASTVRIVDEGVEELDVDAIDADLVGISAITGTAPRAYEIAARLRSRGIPVVLGGVHPTLAPEEAARHADSVVVGYAEDTWPTLLRDFVAGRMAARYDQSPHLKLENLAPRAATCSRRMVNVAHTLKRLAAASINVSFASCHGVRPLCRSRRRRHPADVAGASSSSI